MIEYFKRTKEGIMKSIPSCSKGCWIKVTAPTDEELKSLVKNFDLNEEDLKDGLDIHEIPRTETDEENIYIYLSTPTEKISQEYLCSFLVVYTQNHLITISKYHLEIFEKFSFQSSKKFRDISGPTQILYLLYLISKYFEYSVRRIVKEIKENKSSLNKLDNKSVAKLIENEDKLNSYITPFETMIDNYYRILKHSSLSFKEEDRDFLEDLIIDLSQTLGLCKYNLKSISNMRTYYSTKLSNQLNKTVTVLTIFTIFLAIPTLISSIYGMNISLPFQNSPIIFYFLVGIVILIETILFIGLKKYKFF